MLRWWGFVDPSQLLKREANNFVPPIPGLEPAADHEPAPRPLQTTPLLRSGNPARGFPRTVAGAGTEHRLFSAGLSVFGAPQQVLREEKPLSTEPKGSKTSWTGTETVSSVRHSFT